MSLTAVALEPMASRTWARTIRVLTITSFYPSVQDPTRGRFVSEPLSFIGQFSVSNQTIALQPFYRQAADPLPGDSAIWKRYFSIPTNVGLATAGDFAAKRLLRFITQESRSSFDLIHAHAALPCGHAARVLSRRSGIPFVATVHGLDAFFDQQARGAGSWCRHVAADVYGSARSVICISEKVREAVLRGVRANTVIAYNGVDVERFSPGTESASPLVILSVGNLIPTKGHATLIKAFAQVCTGIPDCVLEIIGDGPEGRKLRQLAAQLGIGKKVCFVGRQSKERVADAMRRCAVFALPSRYEGLGCVYLEAMACGKPVIGCYGQGIDEIIENGRNGILVTPDDADELGKSLRVLLQNADLRCGLGSAARQEVLQRLTLGHQAQKLAEIYRECSA